MQIQLLGPVEAADDGPINLGGRKQRTLAALLASHDGQAVSADQCIDALWGESPPDGAVHSLQTYISALRRLIDPERTGLLESGSDGYRLVVNTDAAAFETAITDTEITLDELAAALSLWRGRPLGELGDDAWARGFVTRFEQLRMLATDDLASARLAAGDPETVVLEMEQAIEEQPFHETFWAHYMTALYQTGRQADSLRAFTRLKENLGKELGIEPSAELMAMEERILLQDPTLARSVTTPNNLPAEVSSLVGRDDDVADVLELLEGSRLVTLVGSGGVGKTRLGLAVARAAMESNPDGVWFIDLAPIESGKLVLPAIAEAFDIEPPALRPLEDALSDAIGDLSMLFVIDNCEHLIEEAAAAASMLLHRSSNSRVLATSQEVLQISGETARRVPSLTLPATSADADEIADCDAADLFSQRARAADPSFRITDDNAAAVASVCRHLDGIPLAIELAAARVRTLSVGQLDERLGETFDVLTSRGRDVLPRHRTLRATIEWSHDHLDEAARDFFHQLGVFVGSFTAEAAAGVTGLTDDEVLEAIDGLVAQSILQAIPGETRRFRLLETLHHYALERLDESGHLDELRTRHLEWAADFCLSESPKLMGDRSLAAVEELRLALDDIRAAMEWSLTNGQADLGLRTAASLSRFWYLNAMHFEGAQWLDRLFAANPDVSDLQMGRAMTAGATTMVRIGRFEDAVAMAKGAVDLLEPLNEPLALGWAYYYLGVASVTGSYENRDEILPLWTKARELMVQAEYPPGIALSTMLIGALVAFDDPDQGIATLNHLLKAAGPDGNPTLVGHSLELRAQPLIQIDQLEEAAADLGGSIAAHRSIGNWACLAHTFEGVSAFLVASGNELDAARIVGGTDTLRLNISTIQAPYERFLKGFYQWEDGIDTRTDLQAAREEGRVWDREQLADKAVALLAAQ